MYSSCGEQSSGNVHSTVSSTNPLIVKNYCQEPWWGYFQYSCDITCPVWCYLSSAALMASLLADVRRVRGGHAFTSAVGVTLPLSRKRCPNLRGISASERRRPGQRSAFPVRQYLVDCHWHRKLKACCRIRRVHNAWPSHHEWALLCTGRLEYTQKRRV